MDNDEIAVRRAVHLLDGADRGSGAGWAAARNIVEECRRNPMLQRLLPEGLAKDLEKLVRPHKLFPGLQTLVSYVIRMLIQGCARDCTQLQFGPWNRDRFFPPGTPHVDTLTAHDGA